MRIATVLALLAGCYLKPSRNHVPRSPEGVQLTLVGQDCEDHLDSDSEATTRHLAVKVRIDNPTDQLLRISGGSVRLTVDGYTAGTREGGVQEVRPHGSAIATWSFVHHALCEREREFVLRFDDALILGDRAITIATLQFHP
jgi:hypothetical protein